MSLCHRYDKLSRTPPEITLGRRMYRFQEWSSSLRWVGTPYDQKQENKYIFSKSNANHLESVSVQLLVTGKKAHRCGPLPINTWRRVLTPSDFGSNFLLHHLLGLIT